MNETIDEIFQLYEDYGNNKYMIGEEVTQIEHMIQTAMIAERESAGTEIILAAFLHDIGHLLGYKNNYKQMGEFGTVDHDKLGGNYLRSKNFPEQICKLVENHVNAKRYLVTVNPYYYETLSNSSKMTLKYQGGKMNDEEMYEFDKDPLKNIYFKFRRWKERSKEINVKLNSIETYKDLMYDILYNHSYSGFYSDSVLF